MLNKKQLIYAIAIFCIVYLILVLPIFGFAEKYAEFYRAQATKYFSSVSESGYVVFEGHEDNGTDDTRIYQTNTKLVNHKGDVESVPYNISTRILGYLPSILLIALFLATPISWIKRLLLLAGGFFLLHSILMFFLYVIIKVKFIETPWLKMYTDIGSTNKSIWIYLNNTINHGIGLNSFLVIIIWLILVFSFEKNILDKFSMGNSVKNK